MLDPVLLHRFVLIICSKATQALPFRDLLRFLASRSSHSEIPTLMDRDEFILLEKTGVYRYLPMLSKMQYSLFLTRRLLPD